MRVSALVPTVAILVAAASALGGCAYVAERSAFERGVRLYHDGAWESSARAFGEAISWAPRNADLYYNRGLASLRGGAHAAAISDLTQALRLRPDDALAAHQRGVARARSGDVAGAQTDWLYALALTRDPATRAWMQDVAQREAAAAPVPAAPPLAAGPLPAASYVVPAIEGGAHPGPPVIGVLPAAPPDPAAAAVRARDLTAHAVLRALDGDVVTARVNLRQALGLEPDPGRRRAIEAVFRSIAGPLPGELAACSAEATSSLTLPPSASPATAPLPEPRPPAAPPPVAAAPAAPQPRFLSDRELLEHADPRHREDPNYRRAFLECMRRLGV